MTVEQLRTVDRLEAAGAVCGATIRYTDEPSASGPVVHVYEHYTDGGQTYVWQVHCDGSAELI